MKYNKNILIIVFLFVIIITGLFAFGSELFAQTYSPLSPLPGDTGAINVVDPGSYFARMFAIFVAVAAVTAVIMLVICGFQYMTSDAISSKEAAKKRCWAAILGLGLLLVSWLILNTINPNLLNLPFASLRDTLKEGVINPATGAKGGGGGGGGLMPFCYVTSSGSNGPSFADAASCNASRDAIIASLDTQINALDNQMNNLEFIISESKCAQFVLFGANRPYYFKDHLMAIIGGPFCGSGNTPIINLTAKKAGVPGQDTCTNPVNVSARDLECATALTVAQNKATLDVSTLGNAIITLELQKPSACTSNPSC